MRKQTKIAAVASAAALLAIGASMTSFADWQNEDGTWYFYDRDGNRVEDVWKPSNGQWYWLSSDEGGAMATNTLVQDDDDTYYVDETGTMVRNQWISIVNEEQDDEDDPAEYNWYYFQSNGKAYKGNGNTVSKKTIDGKRYAFDEDGKMLYGWVTSDGELSNGEDGWADATYYFGEWSDGSMKTGWQQIYVHDDRKDDDFNYWFNFKSNGQKRAQGASKSSDGTDVYKYNSNGHYYHFDDRGVMVYQWFEATDTDSTIANWRYFNSPEDGARATKGWFKVVAPNEDNTFDEIKEYEGSFAPTDAKDEGEHWYYAQSNGELYEGVIENIKGKYFGFWPEDDGQGKGGRMLTGLCILRMEDGVDVDGKEDETTRDQIKQVIAADIDSADLDNILEGDFSNDYWDQTNDPYDPNIYLYYFGNDEDQDGTMKTGNVTINLDGTSYSFFFKKSGTPASGRGRGVTGIDDNKFVYRYGCRIKADSDDKYQLVEAISERDYAIQQELERHPEDYKGLSDKNKKEEAGKTVDQYRKDNGLKNLNSSANINAEGVRVTKVDAPAFEGTNYVNKDDDTVNYHDLWADSEYYYLVNTSGNIQKNKNGARDGNDCYYYVDKNRNVYLYTDNKTLKTDEDSVTANKAAGNTVTSVADNDGLTLWNACQPKKVNTSDTTEEEAEN